jgi:MFS family permease
MVQSTDRSASLYKGNKVRQRQIALSLPRMTQWSVTHILRSLTLIDLRNDNSIGASTARLVSDNLGDSTADDLWIALIPSLVYASLCSTFATLSSLIGRRSSVLISLALFGLASVACGSATTFQSLVVAQVAQSVGGTGLYCMAMIVIPDVTPVSLVPLLPAVMGSTAVAGSLLGPVVGGMLAESGNWRWLVLCPITSGPTYHPLTCSP